MFLGSLATSMKKKKMTSDEETSEDTNLQNEVETAKAPKRQAEKRYECGECGYVGQHPSALKKHIAHSHSEEKPHACPHCRYATKSVSNLNKHLARHGTQRPYTCAHCPAAFKVSTDLRCHELSHSSERPFACNLCAFSAKLKHALTRHVERVHADCKPLLCALCSFATKTVNSLKRHMRRHKGEKPYKCPHCEFSTRHSGNLTYHVKLRHGGGVDRLFSCPSCDFAASKRGNLMYHVRTVHENVTVPCPVCGVRLKHKHSLKSHMKRVHERATRRACPVCAVMLATASSLKRHLSTHKTKAVPCPQCDKTFVSQYQLQTHLRGVHDTRRSQCQLCGGVFSNMSALRHHVEEQHTTALPYACPVCWLTFKTAASVNKHTKQQHECSPRDLSKASNEDSETDKNVSDIGGGLPMIYVEELPEHVVLSNQLSTDSKVCLFDVITLLPPLQRVCLARHEALPLTPALVQAASRLPHGGTRQSPVSSCVSADVSQSIGVARRVPAFDSLRELVQSACALHGKPSMDSSGDYSPENPWNFSSSSVHSLPPPYPGLRAQ